MPSSDTTPAHDVGLRTRKRQRHAILVRLKSDEKGKDALQGIALRKHAPRHCFENLLADILITYRERMESTARSEAEQKRWEILHQKGVLGAARKLAAVGR